MPIPTRLLAATAAVTLLPLTALATTGAAEAEPPTPFAPQIVAVETPTQDDKKRLQALGLDLTERGGRGEVEVVLHSLVEKRRLQAAGFDFEVEVADLLRREAENNAVNAAYAAATVRSPLPSGRDAYRTLAEYEADMTSLTQSRPTLARGIELPHKSLDGRTVRGIEVSENVAAKDGRPTFVLLGLHHAREWPSGELAMEFAYDLVKGYGTDKRITALLKKVRVVVVPVVNVDGFHLSVTDGAKVDLRALNAVDPLEGTASVLATPGQAYKRKNCRLIDGLDTPDGTCALTLASPGGYGAGVDLNRNYGGLWGGPGASDQFIDPTYRGPAPFSEPETKNVQALVSSRQVTTLISNHTFSNLVLRPNGVHPETIGHDGQPVGDAPDEAGLKALGAKMTAANGYANIHGWELYDTTGTTEDWSYNATGGYGYTFEIGPNEFHPPFPEVVDEYLGANGLKGNREAYLLAAEHAADPRSHARIVGTAPAGATLKIAKQFSSPTWAGSYQERLESSMVVPSNGAFIWSVNQSTRPIVQDKVVDATTEKPVRSQTFTGASTRPTQKVDHAFTVTAADVRAGADLLDVKLDWPTPDDLDLEVYRKATDGTLTQVASSGNAPGSKEATKVSGITAGSYVLRVVNYTSVAPSYTLTAALHDVQKTSTTVTPGLIENWTLTCSVAGKVRKTVPVVVDRGGQVKLDLRTTCKG